MKKVGHIEKYVICLPHQDAYVRIMTGDWGPAWLPTSDLNLASLFQSIEVAKLYIMDERLGNSNPRVLKVRCSRRIVEELHK